MNIESKLASLQTNGREWRKPERFTLYEDEARLVSLIDSGEVQEVIDPIDDIAEELAEHAYPHASNTAQRTAREDEVISQGVEYGEWVHFPWSKTVVRYPDQPDHRALRTYRNQHLVTADEQHTLNETTVAVFGLSVGSNITDQLVQSGIGDRYILGDFDRLSPTNLNRIRASMAQVGLRKIDVMARKISEVDPYIEQLHIHEGYTDEADTILTAHRPDILIEEVDNLQAKAQLRQFAAENKIPLVMVTDMGEKSLVDIERHDREDVKPFNGKISQSQYEDAIAGELSEKQKRAMLMKITGPRHLTPRLVESVMDIDKRVSGLPQLGSTAVAGASLATVAAREILLERKLRSGTYIQSPKHILKMQRPTALTQDIATYSNLIKFLKK